MPSSLGIAMNYRRAPLWVSGSLALPENPSTGEGDEWVLFIPRTTATSFRFYLLQEGEVVASQSYSRDGPWSERPLDLVGFPFMVPPGIAGVVDYVFDIDTSYASGRAKFQLFERSGIEAQERSIRVVTLSLMAAVVTLALYNLVLFFLIRDRAYLYHTLFALAGCLLTGTMAGVDKAILWPDLPGQFVQRTWLETGAIACFLCLFSPP